MRALVIALALVACGGRTEVRGTGIPVDASDDVGNTPPVPCGDTSCDTNDSYCRVLTQDGGTTSTCTPLPSKCHTCECANIPKPGLTCVCTSDGLQIIISCN